MSNSSRDVVTLIVEFCKIILIQADCLDIDEAKSYIDGLSDDEKRTLNKHSQIEHKQTIRLTVQKELFDYIEHYSSALPGHFPFAFDSGNGFSNFRKDFEGHYALTNNGASLPQLFSAAFDCIKEASEFYRFFEQFYNVRREEIVNNIETAVETAVKTIVENEVEKVVQRATAKAEYLSKQAAMSAKESAEKARAAAMEEADKAVNQKMYDVTSKVSESSVTILGIFSGIVLTVVAGLFYSSSVIENVGAVNFFRLVCVASLVGLVCFNLIAVMFHFVERIKTSSYISIFSDKTILRFNIILLSLMLVSGVLQFFDFAQEDSSFDKKNQIIVSSSVEVQDELSVIVTSSDYINSNE